ncbi:MAG: DNA mismatch endonuclease Vsr [Armatimonadetes bacterium]|nr:DNA mismatch endonuclease Vsr [Armatimonadota bacterium]
MKSVNFEKLRTSLETTEPVRKSMRSNRSTGTKPEIEFRRTIWQSGLKGYRKNVARLPGKPDIAFSSVRLAVFIHGCFWHGCPRCEARGRIRPPKTNTEYWLRKVQRNRTRFEEQCRLLEASGWTVMTFWECELKHDIGEAVNKLRRVFCDLSPSSTVFTV